MSEPSEQRIREIARRHRPRGWTVKERGPWPVIFDGRLQGKCDFDAKLIVCRPLKCRMALMVFLHEVAHVHFKHDEFDSDEPAWLWEYEAETWAIRAMRAEGISVPRYYIDEAKRYVRSLLEDWNGRANLLPSDKSYRERDITEVPDKVLRFAYGRNWRKHR